MSERLRILWLKTELLHPVDKGGRIRTYQMLRAIAREHHVTYLTLDDGTAAPDAVQSASEYCQALTRIPFHPPAKRSLAFARALLQNLLSGYPYAVSRYRSEKMMRAVRELATEHDLVVCDFLAPAINLPDVSTTPVILFQHNVEAMIWQRHVDVSKSIARREFMRLQFNRMERFERKMCNDVTGVIAVSDEDALEMRRRYGVEQVRAVPTGVDLDYFRKDAGEARSRTELVFTGSMDWMPNDDAMLWFLEEILPLVRTRVPDVRVTIVGRDPSSKLQRLAERDQNVQVTGRVPDVRPYLSRGTVFIVPMRVGGGTRLKIYEAMAMGVPIVSTSIGAEGLPLSDGDHLLLRDKANDFADGVASLLLDHAQAGRIANAAESLVREKFGWEGVAHDFVRQCAQLMRTSKSDLA